MKTVSELQQEIRSIRSDLAKMDTRLSDIDTELLAFKDSLQDGTNYNHIYNLADAMPIIHHPVVELPQKDKSIYFGILLMIATLEDSISDQQLLFLQRMVMADANRKRIDCYMGNLGKIQPDNVIFHLDDDEIVKVSNQLLLDAIIISKLGKSCTIKTWTVVSDIASVLQKNKQEFVSVCNVATAILTQNSNSLQCDVPVAIGIDNKFGYYLGELPAWKNYIETAQKKLLLKDLCSVLRADVRLK